MKTYQDLQKVGKDEQKRMDFLLSAIAEHKASKKYAFAEDAAKYYTGENPTINKYFKYVYDLTGRAYKDVFSPNHKIASSLFGTQVDQEVSYLLRNGIRFGKEDTSKKLGTDFDEKVADWLTGAEIAGISFGFWNYDHLEVFQMFNDEAGPGFVPLWDEEDGSLKAGIRFWQVDTDKPLRITLYELDGLTDYIRRKGERLEMMSDKKPYITRKSFSPIAGTEILEGENYPGFPIFPLKYDKRGNSALVGKRNTLDAIDLVTSNLVNDVDEGNLVYWALTNCNGMNELDDIEFWRRLLTTRVVHADGDEGARAEPHVIEAPFAGTENAIQTLTKRYISDARMFDFQTLATSGNQVATAIKASYEPLNLKADKTEGQVTKAILSLLGMLGIDDKPTYQRSQLINKQEETQVLLMGAEYYDDEYITQGLLAIRGDSDQFEELQKRKTAEEIDRTEIQKIPEEKEEIIVD